MEGLGGKRGRPSTFNGVVLGRKAITMNQKAISDTILQLQAKGDVFTRQVIIEQRRVDDINGVS